MRTLFTLLLTLTFSSSCLAQLNSFTEIIKVEPGKDTLLSNTLPKARISGVGSLNQLSDSLSAGASVNVFAEFNLGTFNRKARIMNHRRNGWLWCKGSKWLFRRGLVDETGKILTDSVRVRNGQNYQYLVKVRNERTVRDMFKLYLNYNINATVEETDRDSVRLADIFFQDRSKAGFTTGLSADLMRFFLRNGSMDNPNPTRNGAEYFKVEPVAEYTFSRWNLRSSEVILDDAEMPIDTISKLEPIQSSQFNFGVRCWYVFHSGENTFGVLFYPQYRNQAITDSSYDTFAALFNNASPDGKVDQALQFYGATIGLQLNKVQFSFQWSELLNEQRINDPNVSGGVFQFKVAIMSDFLTFN